MARKQNAEEFVRFGSFRFAESFVGSRTYDLQDGKNINALAADQLALGRSTFPKQCRIFSLAFFQAILPCERPLRRSAVICSCPIRSSPPSPRGAGRR